MAKKKVDINPDPTSHESNRADPPERHANQGDTIEWVNKTGDRVVISIPDDRVFGQPIAQQIPKGRAWTSTAVKAKKGIFEYGIYCYSDRRYARGLSSPKIIIP